MNYTFMVLLMIFCHVIADYNLQGWLASAKQKEWWEKNSPGKLYEKDYIWALLMHSFSWSFMIMLPVALIHYRFDIDGIFVYVFVLNFILHALVDDMKANKKLINLWTDQIMHLVQIIFTAVMFIVLGTVM